MVLMEQKSPTAPAYRVLADYEVNDPHPLVLEAGAVVEVLRPDPGWPGWVWIKAGGQAGWLPEAWLADPSAGSTTTVRAFNGADLSARRGDLLTALESAPGWIFAAGGAGRTGWFPLFNLRPVPQT
jgi:hypothetical protein